MSSIPDGSASVEEPVSFRLKPTPRAVGAAGEILSRWLSEGSRLPLDRLVQGELRKRHYLNSGERRWVSDAVYGSVRHLTRQEQRLVSAQIAMDGAALAALWQRERVDERTITNDRLSLTAETASRSVHLREQLSFPNHLAAELEAQFGDEAISAAEALNRQAPTTLRVNSLKATRDAVIERIGSGVPTRYSPWGIELPARINVNDAPGYREGWFEIQEEASQIAVMLAAPFPDACVIDIGCGSGGKTLGMAALMQNRGQIHAIDTSAERLEELEKRAARAGVENCKIHRVHADTEGRWRPESESKLVTLGCKGDVVVVDAPCTGSGVIRRSPDAKWRNNDIAAFARLQTILLEQAAKLVAPGGALIYITCAFERAQDEEIITAFVASLPGREFRLATPTDRLAHGIARAAALTSPDQSPGALPDISDLISGDYVRTWPHRHNLDAFFAAYLVKAE